MMVCTSPAARVLLALPFLALMTPAPAAGGGVVTMTLVESGRDVTKEHPDAVVLFAPMDPVKEGTERPKPIRCGIADFCELPPGEFLVDIDAPGLVVETRPSVLVAEVERLPGKLHIPVIRSATVRASDGRIPLGGRLEAVDEKTGVVYSRTARGSNVLLPIPARAVILCGSGADTKPIGCMRQSATPGEIVELKGFPTPAKGRGQLFAGFVYGKEESPWDAAISLRIGERTLRPDVQTARGARVYAVWLDAPAGTGTFDVTSKYWTLGAPGTATVPERATEARMKIPLVRKPSLTVRLANGEAVGGGAVEVTLYACTGEPRLNDFPPLPFCKTVATQSGDFTAPFLFPNLAPAAYAVRWKKAPYESAAWIDLRDGKSREETVPIEPIEVRGRVLRRGHGEPAAVVLRAIHVEGVYRARAGSDGFFTVRVPHKGDYFVTVLTVDKRHFAKPMVVSGDKDLEIELPTNRVSVKVLSSGGDPVGGAMVTYTVMKPPPEGTQVANETLETAPDGKINLPPLPAGILTLTASASGFRQERSTPLEIRDDTAERQIVLTLSPGLGNRIHVLDPSGTPAAGAMVWSSEFAIGSADDGGTALIQEPLPSGAPLFAFDGRGRTGFFRSTGESEQTIQIPPSGPTIVVRFLSADGTPLPGNNVFLSVNGVPDSRVAKQMLLSGGDLRSNPDGRLRIAGLPGEGLLSLYPEGHPELSVTRNLPVTDEIVFYLPPEPATKAK